MTDQQVGDWDKIPQNAFLYFPQGQDIIVEDNKNPQKQWRKIFGGGQIYNKYQTQRLNDLENRLQQERVNLDPFFDVRNKLRFLQANKFKISKAIQSMVETTKLRATSYPVPLDGPTVSMLNSGAFYFCGRDNKYRPILGVDIGKFKQDADSDDSIQNALVIIMELMINQMMIEGHVENYVLIMNLEKATFSLRGVIMKILSFTSNAYRGRLFASYLLAMPSLIRWGWETVVSSFVSENTLKKIKISGDSWHDDMWSHISRGTIEEKYGGDMPNITRDFWPPRLDFLTFTDTTIQPHNHLITPQEYNALYHQQKLSGRKVLKRFLQLQEQQNRSAVLTVRAQQQHWITQVFIRKQTSFPVDNRIISTFFQSTSFAHICNNH